jgi:dihydrofolate reductase
VRTLHVAAFLSLDGVMQAPGGPGEDDDGEFPFGGWIVPHADETTGGAVGELFHAHPALLLGRKTYDIFAGHWPKLAGDPFADLINGMTKYVATRSPGPLDWENSEAIGPDAVAAVRELKAQDGPELMTQGSADLIQSLLAADLVDVITLQIFPVILGRGKRLFGDGAAPAGLKLVSSQTSPSGAVIARYERDGPVKTGSFMLPENQTR